LCETKCLTTISEGTKAASIAGWEYLQEGSCGGGPMRRSQPLSLVQGYSGAASQGWNLEARRVGGARCIFPTIRKKTAGGDVSMAELYPSIAQCAVVATAFKVLLFPA
jgi:hypothetical protein